MSPQDDILGVNPAPLHVDLAEHLLRGTITIYTRGIDDETRARAVEANKGVNDGLSILDGVAAPASALLRVIRRAESACTLG